MVQILDWLEKYKSVTDLELNHYLSQIYLNYNESIYEACLSYLTNVTNVILETSKNFGNRKAYIVDVDSKHDKILNILFASDKIITGVKELTVRKDDCQRICLYIISGWPAKKKIDSIISLMETNDIGVFIFQVGTVAVISHAWMKNACIPCPHCVYDYIMGDVYLETSNTISSLSDAIDYLKN